jgi:hypothetical protein
MTPESTPPVLVEVEGGGVRVTLNRKIAPDSFLKVLHRAETEQD